MEYKLSKERQAKLVARSIEASKRMVEEHQKHIDFLESLRENDLSLFEKVGGKEKLQKLLEYQEFWKRCGDDAV